MTTRLSEVFDERLIIIDLKGVTKRDCFEEMAGRIAAVRPGLDRDLIVAALNDREAKMDTAVMDGVAVPHGYYRQFREIIGAIGFSREGIDYGTGEPVRLVFLLVLGEEAREREKHLRVLSRLLGFLQSGALARLQKAKTPGEVHEILREDE